MGSIHDISPIYGKINTSSHIAEFKLGSFVKNVRIGKSILKLSELFNSIGVEAI